MKQKGWRRRKRMLCMWLDLLSRIVGGLMSSFTHAASFCLNAARPSFSFSAHTPVCVPICLFFDLPSHLLFRHLDSIFKAPFFPLHSSGFWRKNSCTNNRCVLLSQPTTSIFKECYVPNPLTPMNKGDILERTWWSFVQIPFLSQCADETCHPQALLQFRCVDSC